MEIINGAENPVLARFCAQRLAAGANRDVDVGTVIGTVGVRREFELERGRRRSACARAGHQLRKCAQKAFAKQILEWPELSRGEPDSPLRIDAEFPFGPSLGDGRRFKAVTDGQCPVEQALKLTLGQEIEDPRIGWQGSRNVDQELLRCRWRLPVGMT